MIDKLSGLTDNRRVRLGSEFHKDILWWLEFAEGFNGITTPISIKPEDEIWFFTDASLKGFGWWSGDCWQAGSFDENVVPSCVQSWELNHSHNHWRNFGIQNFPPRDININFLELVPVYLALETLTASYNNRHFVCFTDNTQAKTVINKGVSSNASCMELLRKIFWLTVRTNSYVTARFIPGASNVLADSLSRLVDNLGDDMKYFHLCCSSGARNRRGDV